MMVIDFFGDVIDHSLGCSDEIIGLRSLLARGVGGDVREWGVYVSQVY